jgi:hypothetical protein
MSTSTLLKLENNTLNDGDILMSPSTLLSIQIIW